MKIVFNQKILNQGYLLDKYSKYAQQNYLVEGVPVLNFPFEVAEINPKFKYLSWILIDHDSNPVVNFSWLHWVGANYQISDNNQLIPEGLSLTNGTYTRGRNSFGCPLTAINDLQVITGYGGPTPPDKDHVYHLEVYAYNQRLELEDGFYYNQLLAALEQVDYQHVTSKIHARH